jgi:FAD/FMN-containing dehydrogenase
VAQQQVFDPGFPTGSNYYAKAGSLADLGDEAIDILIEYASTKPSSLSGIAIQTVFGAASRVAPDATAFCPRAFPYAPIIVAQWLDPAQAAENVAWARDCWGALQPFAGGVYVNDLGENDEERVPAAYGANYQRLATLKNKYDPDNFFRLNPNIKPAA